MDLSLITMGDPVTRPRAGAHSSDGMFVDTHWHTHDMHQLLYAFEGAVEVEGAAGRYRVPRQYAVWIPAGAAHRTSIHRIRSGSVFLSPDMVPAAPDAVRVVAAPPLMREMIIHAMRWPIDRAADTTGTLYFDCFAKLCVDWLAQQVDLILPSSTDDRIKAIIVYTECNIATVTMAGLCAAVGTSERTLRRHFKKAMGISWEEFRKRLRICLAIDDLDSSNKRIGAIAADVGYDSQAAFAKAFRSVMGSAPLAYRKSTWTG